MDRTLRNGRLAAVVLLFLCATPHCVEAQQFVCGPIVPGDTAVGLARRLTGAAAAAYSQAFQIRDPARQMFVPKSHYARLSTDWQACVATRPVRSRLLAYAPVVALAAPADAPAAPADASAAPAVTSAAPAVTSVPSAINSAGPARPPSDQARNGFVLIATIASAVSLMLLFYAGVGVSLTPRPIPLVMQRAGQKFVNAFERPLIDSASSDPPIHVRLRFSRRAQRLEIRIAPGAGRRYPNLVDHKRNVEYDVNRVMRVLGRHFVVSDRLRAAGKWVVVPIRLAEVK